MGYPASRSTTIAALVFAFVIPVISVIVISKHARSGDEYLHALSWSSAQEDVVIDLGDPIDDGVLPSIKWPMSEAKPTVNINMTLKGPNGKGTMSLTEVREPTGWRVIGSCWTFNGKSKRYPPEALPTTTRSE